MGIGRNTGAAAGPICGETPTAEIDIPALVRTMKLCKVEPVLAVSTDRISRVFGLMPNQLSARIGAAAEQAGLGPGYSGESPRLGMLKDLDELGAVLLGEQLEDRGFPDGAGA